MIKRITYCIIFYCSVLAASGRDYSIAEFGAKSDGKSDNSQAFQRTIDACSNEGGGTVSIPSGIWLTGTVFLKSNVSIYLSGGATWKAINDTLAFSYLKTIIMSIENIKPALSMIYASNVDHVKIYGEGILDGGGDYEIFQVRNKFQKERHHFRPYGIYMINCSNITLDGICMTNSALWMQRYQNCRNLKLNNLTIFNHSNYNNDGIDIDGCEDVLVSNCNVDSSDDALCLKSEGTSKCKNIVVTNCILSSHATPLKLGTGSIGGFENIVISNILIRPSKSKEMIHELKSWRGLSGIDILSVDGGTIDGVSINNVMMDSIETPFFIKLGNRHSKFPGSNPVTEGKLRNVRISNIVAKNCGSICSAITGYPGAMVENVWLSDIYVHVNEGLNQQITAIKVPENSDGYPCNRMFGKKLPATGLYVRHAKNVNLNNFQVSLLSPDARPVIWLEDVKDVIVGRLKADKPSGGGKLIVEKQSELKVLD